jgi:hypothetical protein
VSGPLLLALAVALAQQGFERVGEREGVVVYRRAGARFIELAAEGELPAPPERVLGLLTDYETHVRWVKGLGESRVLSRGEGTLDVYQRLSLPMVSDRDFTLRVTWGGDGEARWLRFTVHDAAGPAPRSGIVRVTTHDGEWELAASGGGTRTRATYRLRLDLGGAIPSWIARSHALKDVPGLFSAIRRQLTQ